MSLKRAKSKSEKKKPPEHITYSRLKGEHYWTDKMIRDLLGDPDKTAPNPHYRSGAPMKLYLLSRIIAIEQTLDLDAMRSRRLKRSLSAKKAAATRKRSILERAQNCDLQCDFSEPIVIVRKNAVRHHDDLMMERDIWYDYPYRKNTHHKVDHDVDYRDRWAVNYLRHERTDYDYWLYILGGAVRHTLRERIHGKIAKTYPELSVAAEKLI